MCHARIPTSNKLQELIGIGLFSTVSQVSFPGKETEICVQEVYWGEPSGKRPLGAWRQGWIEEEVGQSQQKPQQVPKGALELRGPFGVVPRGGQGAGPSHLRMDRLILGCGLSLGRERNFGQSDTFQLSASHGRNSAVSGSRGWQPQPWRGIREVHQAQRNLQLIMHSSLKAEEMRNRTRVYLHFTERETKFFWYVLKISQQWKHGTGCPGQGFAYQAYLCQLPLLELMKHGLKGKKSKLLRGKCFDQK